jgi:hypothetical protein
MRESGFLPDEKVLEGTTPWGAWVFIYLINVTGELIK